MKRPVEHKDLLGFHFLSNPAFSPDGERIAYRLSRPDLEKNGYASDIWIADLTAETNRRLTASGSEQFFCWSLDGARIVFASKRGEPRCSHAKGNAATRFYSIGVDGGEAELLFEIPHAANAIQALPGERYLITTVFEREGDGHNPEGADMMVFEQLPFMANGKGYIGQRRIGLGVYDGTKGEFTRLTPPLMDVARTALNAKRTAALLVASDYRDVKLPDNAVYELDLVSGDCRCLTPSLAYTFKHAAWSDGEVVVTAADRRSTGVNQNARVYHLRDGRLGCLTPELDSSLGHAIVADSGYGCSELSGAIFPSGMGLICCATDVMKSRICSVTPDGRLKTLTSAVSAVIDYAVSDRRIAYVAYEGLNLPELHVLEGGAERRITAFNRPLFEELSLSQPIHVSVEGGDGWVLDGWYMRPVNFREGERYPTILHIHGGPKAAFGDVYHHEMQCWAARGYAVIYCNPRGGDGRGSAFEDIRGRYGDADYRDLMAFTDWCVKNLKFIDPERLGVTGGSYGGYMTNWIITRTDRFKAAVSQRGIANWVSKFGGCDIGYYYVEDQHLGTPWSNPEAAWAESPVRYADRARTPTLFIHSTEDFRCELNQGFQMFTALKVLGVEARMCVFKGENHELSRSGKPANRLARLREICDWFDNHL